MIAPRDAADDIQGPVLIVNNQAEDASKASLHKPDTTTTFVTSSERTAMAATEAQGQEGPVVEQLVRDQDIEDLSREFARMSPDEIAPELAPVNEDDALVDLFQGLNLN